jgi:Ca2+-binding RTX toxin-like protein
VVSLRRRSLGTLVGAVAFMSSCAPLADEGRVSRSSDFARSAMGEGLLADLPTPFVENRGQVDKRAIFHVQRSNTSIAFTETGLAVTLAGRQGASQRWGLRQDFLGARPARPIGQRRLDGVVSYFTGSPDRWKSNVPTYGGVVYKNLWPGIDLAYAGSSGSVKYELRLDPGADPSDIRLRWRGATEVLMADDGSFSVVTPYGTLTDAAPVAYQRIEGRRVPVHVQHKVGGTITGFRLGRYDPTQPLVIDPTLEYAGYIGGSGDEGVGSNVAVDAAGAAYVVGQTDSASDTFPETVGPFLTKGMGTDAFVAKVSPDGKSLVYAGYIGGDGEDAAFGIAVDASGAAYLTGQTTSDAATFPETVGPDLTKDAGPGEDAFVAKVNPAGTALVYAGYIGGDGVDLGFGIAVDGAGAAYVTGYTDSSTGSFPVLGGPATTKGAASDAFVSKVLPSGTGFAYSGYIGGDGDDEGNSVAVDASGSAYVTGDTDSDETTFPESGGPDLSFNGVLDAFVAKVNPAGSGLTYAGYIGGAGDDVPLSIAVDAADAAYVTGFTDSDETTFPETVGPDLSFNGVLDAFVAKVSSSGGSLAYAGYLGGAGDDRGHAIAVDASGGAYVAGRTTSDAATFPEKAGPFLTPGGGIDAFLAKVIPGGTGLVYAGYLGGSGRDIAYGIDADSSGAAFVAGETASFTAVVGPDVSHNGGADAFLAKIAADCDGTPATIVGTEGNDVLTGTAGDDVIAAYGGNDTIDAGGGNDRVCAGAGSDTVNGGDGDDTLDGEEGDDTILGGGGVDTISGGLGNDTVEGGSGNDTATGGDGADTVNGGSGDDTLDGEAGNDTLEGGDGNDTVTAGDDNDVITGSGGNDTLHAGAGRDLASGGPGADVVNGQAGADRVNGGGGADRLSGEIGTDRLNGGGGSDRLRGGKGNDRLNGGAQSDRLNGNNGNDRLNGGSGNDRLTGGKGRDRCTGGRGLDTGISCRTRRSIP